MFTFFTDRDGKMHCRAGATGLTCHRALSLHADGGGSPCSSARRAHTGYSGRQARRDERSRY
jgi:hypothetical protein